MHTGSTVFCVAAPAAIRRNVYDGTVLEICQACIHRTVNQTDGDLSVSLSNRHQARQVNKI
jgi:hypothetical protein